MKAHLMFVDRDFDAAGELPSHTAELEQDLGLPTLYAAMARGDKFLYDVARHGVLSELADADAIAYRQRVLRDCLANPDVVRQMYDIAVEAVERERKFYMGIFSKYPITILHRSVEVLQMFAEILHRLRHVADTEASRFSSDGFRTCFAMLVDQLSDEYFATVAEHLRTLKFRGGVLMSARIGQGNKGTGYVLRTPLVTRWKLSDLFHGNSKASFTIPERDEAGHQALSELRDRGINLVANALAQSTDHVLSFFTMLRSELGFYVGCMNLYETLYAKDAPVIEPQARPTGSELNFTGLYDIALALSVQTLMVGNDSDADGKDLIVVTGANQGGKSTFLRSLGLAHLMMQPGMFVPATTFRASVSTGVFTHYKREEDASMRSGKLDEEMARMSEIADEIRPGGLLLCNESFASTNEREGSEISRQIIMALLESRVRVVFVTHLYDLSEGLYHMHREDALFLRAECDTAGRRSFRLLPGEPLPTSFGPDLYARIFQVPQDAEGRQLVESAAARPRASDRRGCSAGDQDQRYSVARSVAVSIVRSDGAGERGAS